MVEIRTANADELPEILAMEARYTDNDASIESFRETFESHSELFVVCVDDDEIVGEASGYVAEDADDAVVLESIAVVNDRQGDGIGRRVLEYFEEQAEQYADRVSLASADDVEGFYSSLGYQPTKILLQLDAEDAPDEYDDRITDEKVVDDSTIFLYAEFEEYDPEIRRELKAEFGAFEVNTIYEKALSE